MKIRRGELSDLEELMSLLNSSPELNSGSETPTYTESFVRACLIDREMDLVLIALEDGKIIGFLMAEMWKKKKNSFLLDLFVKPGYRKRGIAEKLRARHEEICKKRGVKRIHCLVLTTNKRMQKYVGKRGYERCSAFYFYEKELR